MAKIFISYRREDAPGSAGRLYDRLQQEFGRDNVFIDVNALQPGDDFVEAIGARLSTCDVMLAVIGRRWLTASDEHHGRRLDDARDHLRIELQTALDRHIRLIPVLVERAAMPLAHELPEPLRPLARRQAFELRDTRWVEDITLLVEAINRLAPATSMKTQVRVTQDGNSHALVPRALQTFWPAVAILTVALVVALAVWVQPNIDQRANSTGERGEGAPSPTGKTVADRLQSQCDGADAFVSCKELGNMYLLGRGVTKDYVRAVALYSKACEAGNMAGCRDLGGMYADGQGVARDEARGVALYRRACDGGDASGCLNLGFMYGTGRGVPKDDMLARPLYEKACNTGEPIGCRNLGNFYLGGRGGVAKDEARGRALLQKACKGGDDTACLQLEETKGT